MAATPAQMRAGIVAALNAVLSNVLVSAYRLPSPGDRTLQIIGNEVEYDLAMRRGADNWTFQLQALAGSPVSQAAQMLLDEWKAPAGASVKAAIDADPTLGGIVAGARVVSASDDQIYVPNPGAPNVELLGATFDVQVINTGN
jgi:hypothetical protein